MSQLDADQYIRLTPEHTYGRSDGLYWDRTNSLLVLVINDVTVFSIDAAGAIIGGALEASDLNVASQARGDLLRRGAAAWERLAAATSGRILVGDGTDVISAAVSGDGTMSAAGVLAVTDLSIASEARGDLVRRGASAWERLSAKTSGQILVGDGTDVVSVAVSGDGTMSAAGALAVTDLSIASEARGDLVRRGAAAWERLPAATSGQILVGDGTDIASVAVSGDATLAANGALTVTDVTVGSDAAGDLLYKSSATALARLAKGTAGQVLRMNAGATAPTWSDDLESTVVEDFSALDTTDEVALILPSGLAASGATGVMNHLYSPGGKVYCVASLGAGQTAFPVIVANGLDIGGDQVADEGWEIWSHFAGASGKPFVVGKSPAFYFTCTIEIADADGIDHLMVGFRRAGPHLATFTDIQDYSAFGVSTAADPAALKLLTGLTGTDTNTDTTQTFAEATAIQFKVLVSAAGVVTFQHDIVVPGTLAAPTVTVAQTIGNGVPMIPFVRYLHDTGVGSPTVRKWDAGLQ